MHGHNTQAWPIHEQTKDTPLTLLDISDDTRSLSLSIQHSTKYYIVIPLTGLAIIMSNIILHLISNNRKTDNLHKTVYTHRNPIRLEVSRSKIQACSYFRVRVYNRLRGKFEECRFRDPVQQQPAAAGSVCTVFVLLCRCCVLLT